LETIFKFEISHNSNFKLKLFRDKTIFAEAERSDKDQMISLNFGVIENKIIEGPYFPPYAALLVSPGPIDIGLHRFGLLTLYRLHSALMLMISDAMK